MNPLEATVALLAVVGISLHVLFMRRLQLRCPQEWQRLGSPNPYLANDVRTSWRLTKYVLSGRFRQLPEASVVRLGHTLRIFGWIWFSGWGLYIALILFVAIPAWL